MVHDKICYMGVPQSLTLFYAIVTFKLYKLFVLEHEYHIHTFMVQTANSTVNLNVGKSHVKNVALIKERQRGCIRQAPGV